MPSRTGRTLILRHWDVNATPDVGRNLHSVIHESESQERKDSFYRRTNTSESDVAGSEIRIDEPNVKKLFHSIHWGALLHGSFLRAFRLIVREAVDPY